MGMYDEIRCEAPLPDAFDATHTWFQTKSFPDPCLQRYTITADGGLIDSRGNDCRPDGYIEFYDLDPSRDEMSPDRWREYRARFVEGRLHSILRISGKRDENVYYGLASLRWFAPLLIDRQEP